MPHMQMTKGHVKKNLLLLLLLICLGAILLGIHLWESNRRNQAVMMQEQIDEPARRRREGWIEKDGQWYAPKSELETILIAGIDKMEPLEDSGSYNNDGQADFLLLGIFDELEETTTILHINRDTMAQIPVLGVTGQHAGSITGQLALAHTYGSGLHDSFQNTVQAVSDFLHGVEIDHYVGLTMGAVPYLNNLVGGVTVEVLDDFTGIDETLVKGETVTLMGQQALNYVRIRAGMEDSSNLNRMKRQQQYLEALAEKVQNLGDDFSISAEQISLLSDYVISDCSIDELKRMAEEFVNYEIQPMQDIKGTALKGEEYMEFYPDQQALEEQILELFYEVKKVADEDANQPS